MFRSAYILDQVTGRRGGILLALSAFLVFGALTATAATHFTESFENPDTWSGYTTGTVNFDSGDWDFVSVYPETSGDSYDGVKAARINDDIANASITAPSVNSVGTVSFYYHRPYTGTGSFELQKSVGGGGYTTLDTVDFSSVTTPTYYSYDVNDSSSDIRIRVQNDDNTAHLTIDLVTITDYAACAPDDVDFVQQTNYYTKFTDGGDIFNSGGTEMGMWANGGGSKQVVAWRDFRTDGSGGGDPRDLQPGDRFRISVHGYSPFGILGASINDGASTGSWANRHSNTRGYIECGNVYGDLYVAYDTASTVSWSGIRPWNTTVTLVFDILSSAEFTANIEGQTPKYDLLMKNSPGDNDRVSGFSLYYNDDWNGSGNQNAYWKQTTLVTNLGEVTLGADNGTRNIVGKITDGTDPVCENVSTNVLVKKGTGTVTLQNTANTYSGGTRIENGTLAVFADGNIGTAPSSPANNIDIWSTGTLRATNTFTLDSDRTIQLGNTDGPAVSVDSGKTLTYAGVIGGDADWSKEGAGILALTGTSSTNTGVVAVEAGTLRVSGDGSLGATPASAAEKINIWSTGTFEADGTFTLNANRTIAMGTVNGPQFSVTSGNTLTFGGDITGSAVWSKEGAGALTLTGSRTGGGDLLVESGTFTENGTNTSMNVNAGAGTFVYGAGSLGSLSVTGQASAGSASNTVGQLAATGLSLEDDGILQVNLSSMTGTAGADWDVITVGSGSGTYTVNATDGNDFIIALKGNPTFDNAQGYTNIIIDAGTASGFVANKFTVDTSEFQPDLNSGTFSVDADSGNLRLIFVPSSIATIAFQGFEGSTNDTWNYTFNETREFIYVDGDTNASGDYALTFRGSDSEDRDPTIEFDNIDISGFASVKFKVAFAVAGADANDNLHLDVSYDDGATWTGVGSTTLVSGASNTNLGFTGLGSSTVTNNPWIASISAGSQVKIRIRFDESVNANTFDRYFIDDVELTGIGTDETVSFSALTYYVDETNTSVTVPVNISSAADATVRVALAGTAVGGGTDYSVNSTNVIFTSAGGISSNVVFTLNDDVLAEGLEEIQLRLVDIRGATPAGRSLASVLIRDDDSFTVMSANLTAGTNVVDGTYVYEDSAKRIIQRLRPDIVAIQEWKITNATYRQFVDEVLGTDYSFYVEPEGDPNPIPNGVISRWPIVSSNEWTDGFVGARDYVHAEVDIPGPKNLNVISVHFKAGSGSGEEVLRENEARELTNYIASAGFAADDYMIIGADLNLTNFTETTYLVITSIVSGANQSHDQDGDLNTNLGRSAPYDHVLPDYTLDAEHVAPVVGGYTYTNGMVFDSEQFGDHLLPVLVKDSYTINRTHMAIMKVFNVSTTAVPPTVTTSNASLTNVTTATVGGYVSDDGDATVTNRGIVWSTSPTPTVPGIQTTNGTGVGSFQATMDNLTAGETYYFRAYAQNEAGIGYGEEFSLTALCFTSVVQNLHASSTNDVNFTATWDAFDGATGYAIDVSTNANFGGGGSGGTLLTVDFETANDGYTPSTTTGSGDIDVFNRTDVSNGSNDGFYWAVEDLPVSDPTMTLDSIDISSVSSFDFSIDFLTPNSEDWDNTDSLIITYSVDGGAFQNLMAVENDGSTFNTPAQLDADFDGDGDGTALLPALVDGASAGVGSNFETFNTNGISISGTGLVVRLEFYGLDATAEGIYFDNIIISNSAAGGGAPDFVDHYSNRTVSATSVSVTGLTTGVEYFFRVRATNEYCIAGNSDTASVTTIFISPDIDVIGNSTTIANGDTTPSLTDDTIFGWVGITGSNVVHTFSITNSGTSSLSLDNVAVGGANASDFTVTAQPAASVAVDAGTTFTVQFDPSGTGARTAILYITNNVAAENPYIFHILGTGVAPSIARGPASISVTTMVGSDPANESFGVTNDGLGQLVYAVTSNQSWLSFTPVSDTLSEGEDQQHTLSFGVSGLYAGTSNATITITDANADDSPQTIDVTLTLTNIPDPTVGTATPDGYELIDLAWTKAASHDVLVIYREGSAPTAPVNGTSYTAGDAAGGGSVVYVGGGAAIEHIVQPGSDHYYAFHSVNNNHYSPGIGYYTNTGSYALGEIVDAFAYTNAVNFGSGASEDGGNGFTNAWQVGAETWTVEANSMDVAANYPDEVANSAKLTNPGNGDLGFMTRGIAPVTSGTFYASAIIRFQYQGGDKYTGIELTSNGTAKAFFGEIRDQDRRPGIAASATASSWDYDGSYGLNDYNSDPNNIYLIVGRYDFSSRSFQMAVYYRTTTVPLLEPSTWNASNTLAAGTMNWIDGIRLVAGSSDGGATLGDAFFDEVRVADSWANLIGQFPEPEIAIAGTNFIEIADGETSTSTSNGTDFGSTPVAGGNIDNTFYITNSGLGILSVSGVSTSGTHDSDFIVLDYPESVYPGTASNLVIRFDPSAAGARTATITVDSDDGDEAAYDFAVKGTGQVPPTVTTSNASTTNATSAETGGFISDEGFAGVTNRGVVWSTSTTPTVDDNATSDGTGAGSFSSTMTGLTPGETYYYRAYAENVAGRSYGSELTLTTPCFSGVVTGLYVSATNDTFFTAVWSNFAGASGYAVDVSTASNFTGSGFADLIISEYVEGSSNNKYIELYNGTGGNVDLSDYILLHFNNGSSTPTYTLALSGTLADDTTYVIENSSEGLGVTVDLSTSASFITFNGDDAIALSNVTVGGYVDIIGQIGTDPGSEWGSGTQSTADNTIRRKSTVTAGDTDGTDAFDPATEWDGYAQDTVADLGSHTVSGSNPSYVAGYSNRPVATTTITVTGLTESVEYFIRVRATNDYCDSSNSDTDGVTTIATVPGIGREPTNFTYSITVGDTIAAEGFGVTNVGTGTLDYDLTTNANWLSVSPVSGSVLAGAGQQHTITYSTAGLGVGTSNATITITDAGATNSPLTIEIELTLSAIADVASASVTNDGNEMVRIGWTASGYDVLIVHNETNAPSAPVNTTAYSVGDAVGSDGSRVIYNGSGSSLEHVVEPGSINHYAFYSVNNDHYSDAVTANTTMDTYDAGVVVETFSYTNATDLAYGTGGQGFSAGWAGDTETFTNVLYSLPTEENYPSNAANKLLTTPAAGAANIVTRTLDDTYESGVIYVSFVMNYEYGGAVPDAKFAGLSLMDGGTEKLFVGEVGSDDQKLGLDGTASAKTLTAGISNDYVIIMRYSWASGTAVANAYEYGVDTVPLTEPGSWQASIGKASNTVGSIDGIRLASGATSGTPGNTYFDEIRISTTWEDLLETTPSPVIYDWFANSSGTVSGDNGGTGWSNTWTFGGSAFIDFTAGSFAQEKSSYHAVQGNKIVMYGDVDDRDMTLSRDFLTPFTTGVVYFSWMQNYEFDGINKYAGMSLMDGTTEKAFVGKVADGSYGKIFGVASSTDNRYNTDIENGTGMDYVIVGKYDFSTRELSATFYDTSTNAIAEEPQGYWTVVTTQSVGHITRLSGIRFGIGAPAAAQIGDVYIDEVRVGTNFYEVTRQDGESQSAEMVDGPVPTLLYIGTNYLTANNPQGGIGDITITDADLSDTNEPLDIAVLWTNTYGVYLTNSTSGALNFGSRQGRVDPNWDPVVLSGSDFLSVGYDAFFTNFVGYNGAGSVTTYVHGAFNITNSTFDDTYYITMSAENNNLNGGTFTAPNGLDAIPYHRALTINTALQFFVQDDDPNYPEFFEYTIDGVGGFGDTNLIAGSIAIIGVNGSVTGNNERFSFVVLRPFPAGTRIQFTDRGWSEGSNTWHRPSEFHTNAWVSPGNAAVGQVVELELQDINNGGDQVVVFQYYGPTEADTDSTNITFLYAVNLDPDGDGWDADPVPNDNEHSGIYRGLTNGETAVSVPIGSYDANAYYTGSVVGTASELLSWISDSNNWYVVPSGSSSNLVITNYSFTVTGSGTFDWDLATISDEQALLGGYRVTNIVQDGYSGIVATNTSFASSPYFMLFSTNSTPITSNLFPVTFANGDNNILTLVMDAPAGDYTEITLGTVTSHVYAADMDNDRTDDHLDDLLSLSVNIYDDDGDAPETGTDLVTLMLGGTAIAPTNGSDLLAGWNFNQTNTAVSHGSGTYSDNLASGPGDNAGTTINAVTNDIDGRDLTVSLVGNIGRYIAFDVDMTGHSNLVMTFAARRSGSGYDSNDIIYRVNGGSNVVFESDWTPNLDSFALKTVDFSSETAMNNATSVEVFIYFGVDAATGGGNNRFDNFQFNADISRYYEITDAQLTNVGGASPLQFSFNAFDSYSGLSRGTTDNGSNMTISVDGLYTNNTADFNAGMSSASSTAGDSTSVWAYATAIDYARRGELYADGESNRVITATFADADNDRFFDTLWQSNAYFGTVRVIDDDYDPPTNVNISYGGLGNGRPFHLATNGGVTASGELIRGNYPRRYGSGVTSEYAVTDADLANSGTIGLEFIFGVMDEYSEIGRGTSGGTNNVMSISIGTAVSDNYANYDVAKSSTDSGPGVLQSNYWTFANGFFDDSIINAMMAASSNNVAITVPDTDNDRTNDQATLVSKSVGSIRVYDDDVSGPTMSLVDLVGVPGGSVILSTSFETNQMWPTDTSGYVASTNWNYTDGFGTWYGSGAFYTTLNNKNTGTRRVGLLVNTNAPTEQWLQLPPVDNPGSLSLFAARFSGGDATIKVERASGGSWVSVGSHVITNNQDDLFMNFSFDINIAANDVTLRVVRVGATGPQVSLDDISISSTPTWISTNSLTMNWYAAVDDYSDVDYYGLVAPAITSTVPSSTNAGVQYASSVTSRVEDITGQQGVLTGFVYSVDNDSDRADDAAMGNVVPIVVRVDTNPPPAVADFAGSNDIGDVTDTTSEIKLSWTPEANERTAAGKRVSDDTALSPFVSYRIYYTENTMVDPTYSDDFFDFTNSLYSDLGTYSTTEVTIDGLTAGFTYHLAMAGVDEAGNVGPMSDVAVVTLDIFGITYAYANEEHQTVIQWDGNDLAYYDVIYADSTGYADNVNTMWKLAATVQGTQFIDEGGTDLGSNDQRDPPNEITAGTMRFYRISPVNAWIPAGGGAGAASEEVIVAHLVSLMKSNNFVGISSIPYTMTIAEMFGTNRLYAGIESTNATQLYFYEPNQTGDAVTNTLWLSVTGWLTQANGWANTNEIPFPHEGFVIDVPADTNLLMVGRVPYTNTPPVTVVETQTYNILSMNLPRPTKVSDLGIRDNLESGMNLALADEIRIMNKGTAPWGIPRARIFLWTNDVFVFQNYSSAENFMVQADEAIILYSRGNTAPFDADWAGTNYYTKPTITISGTITAAPTVKALSTIVVDTTNATLRGTVNPNLAVTEYWFEYGTTTNYGTTLSGAPSLPATNVAVVVSSNVYGLVNGATYYFQVVASNAIGLSRFGTGSFTISGGPTDMAYIPAQTFVMGANTNVGHESAADQLPQHGVSIGAVYMDKYEVTSQLWDTVYSYAIGASYGFTSFGDAKDTDHPQHSMDWFDAVKWCNARSEMEGLTPVYYTTNNIIPGNVYRTGSIELKTNFVDWAADGYRLPTEAEWEAAARGGLGDYRFPWTDYTNNISHAKANFDNSGSEPYQVGTTGYHPTYDSGSTKTAPVGSFGANAYGLYDMSGNVDEMCWDYYDASYYSSSPGTDPRGPDTVSSRVIRGGSWEGYAVNQRIAFRNSIVPSTTDNAIGFRTVRKAPE